MRRRWTTERPFVAIAASRRAKALIAYALDKALFHEITAQLKTEAIRVKTGTLVDATIIASASQEDRKGRWVKHKGPVAVHGFKAHVGAHANTALVEQVGINDGMAGPRCSSDDSDECSLTALIRARSSERPFATMEHRRHLHVEPR